MACDLDRIRSDDARVPKVMSEQLSPILNVRVGGDT